MDDHALVPYMVGGGSSGALVLLYWLLGKLIDKHKPTYERRREERLAAEEHRDKELSELRGQVAYWQGEVAKCQNDISELRIELRKMSAERHHFYDAIIRCSIEHPSTAEWWSEELKRIKVS